MKHLKLYIFILVGVCVAGFLIFKDYEVARDPTWPESISVYSNPVTNRYRVVDKDDETTLFYYAVDAFARPVTFQKDGDKWVVTFVKK